MTERRVVRCAIYTRKSSDEGLEQEFNSLDAQFEACAAYILSQRHEGWVQNSSRYDDGGCSGGNLNRPGLKRLMNDVANGKVDVIVVYKVDRLTRALADFARIVEVLDAQGASFVSVTQALNSTTSMGRLTLNVLLSFAQFEREVTGERIRDKIAASKKKGMFMGGPVPIGYQLSHRKLIINDAEAAIVRHIYTRYVALGSGRRLIDELRANGYRTKVRRQGNRTVGGIPFGRGVLFHILSNPIYLGKTVHKGVEHDGEHPRIIGSKLWAKVQKLIAENRVNRCRARNANREGLLTGLLCDGHRRRMTPAYSVKNGKLYRYYVTHSSELRGDEPPAWRMPAECLEDAVVSRLVQHLSDYREIANLVGIAPNAADLRMATERACQLANELRAVNKSRLFGRLLKGVTVEPSKLVISVDLLALASLLQLNSPLKDTKLQLEMPLRKVRQGTTTKLVLASQQTGRMRPDKKLLALLAEAHVARETSLSYPEKSIRVLAAEQGRCRHRLSKLIRLSWISPKISTAIMEGRQVQTLTPRQLLQARLPLSWKTQEAAMIVS